MSSKAITVARVSDHDSTVVTHQAIPRTLDLAAAATGTAVAARWVGSDEIVMDRGIARILTFVLALVVAGSAAGAQVEQEAAAAYFAEAAALCERDAGQLWGVSLCGPMVFADATTGTIATNQPAPAAERPRSLGFANAAMHWGEERWSTYVWQFVPRDDAHLRARLMMHELFHRVQFDLDLITANGDNGHLDTLEGRYWLQLEWRALARALGSSGVDREEAVGDALAFRAARREAFPEAAENERLDEIREGLAQYTGTVTAAGSAAAAVADAIAQLDSATERPTFVRTFAYPSGAAYGLLLDAWSPGWTRRVTASDDLAAMLTAASGARASEDLAAAAVRYRGDELRAEEQERELQRLARVEALRARFVDGPVLRVPRGNQASFMTTDSTPIPGAGTTLSSYRVSGPWGSLEAETILVASDGETLILPAPEQPEGTTLSGPGWSITLAKGWSVERGPRDGDFQIVEDPPR